MFLYDRVSGTMTLVSRSVTSPNWPGDEGGESPSISGDGRYVAFQSYSFDLVPGQQESEFSADVFLYDRLTGTTTLVSRAAGTQTVTANAASQSPVISTDGSAVLFLSEATNLVPGQVDTSWTYDLFLYDIRSRTVTLPTIQPAISDDGRYVVFSSYSHDLVPGFVDNNYGSDVFLYDRSTQSVTLVSRAAGSTQASGDGITPTHEPLAISGDGRYVSLVSSSTNLVPGQTSPVEITGPPYDNVFLYDRVTGTMSLVSRSSSSPTTTGSGFSSRPALSGDGRYVVFLSEAPDLVPGQTGPLEDNVFLYDRESGTVSLVSRSRVLGGRTGNQGSALPIISRDGKVVVFTSEASDLVAGDFNFYPDIFAYSVQDLPPQTGTDFFTLIPCRVLDTRQPQDGPALASGQAEILSLHGVCGVPATVRAIAVNVTVTQPTGAGYVSFAPGDLGDPVASTINFGPGQTRANNAILPLALNGTGTLRVSPAVAGNGTVHMILDVVGYFE